MRFFLTGGAGFVGSHLAERLLDTGHTVTALDDLSTGREENLKGVASRIELLVGDLRDPALLGRAVQDITHVVHLAALPSVARSVLEVSSV